MAEVQKQLGIPTPDPPLDEAWREGFDEPAWTRKLFGPQSFDDDAAVKS